MPDLNYDPGQTLPVEECEDSEVIVDGNWSGPPLYFGNNYCFRYRLSPQYLRSDAGQGARIPIAESRLQLRNFIVSFSQTQYFKVEVTPEISGTTYEYTVGDDDLEINSESLNLQDDSLDIPVLAENDKVQIDLVNCSPFPSNFLTGSFSGEYAPKARRIG